MHFQCIISSNTLFSRKQKLIFCSPRVTQLALFRNGRANVIRNNCRRESVRISDQQLHRARQRCIYFSTIKEEREREKERKREAREMRTVLEQLCLAAYATSNKPRRFSYRSTSTAARSCAKRRRDVI